MDAYDAGGDEGYDGGLDDGYDGGYVGDTGNDETAVPGDLASEES